MRHNTKNNLKMFSISCSVTKNQLINVVKEFTESEFFISIENIGSDDPLCMFFCGRSSEMVHIISIKELKNITVRADVSSFLSFVDLLLKCEAEVILLCFPNPDISFEKFVVNKRNLEQTSIVSQGLCSIICTWVTNNYELFFHYDEDVLQSGIKEKIKKIVSLSNVCYTDSK